MSEERILLNGWVHATLGVLGEYINGKAFNDNDWSKEGRPIIRIQDLTGTGKAPNYYDGEIEEKYMVRPGDLLIAWSATLGAYIWHGPEACLNQHIFKVTSYIDKMFHYYLVQSIVDELYRNAHGSGMVHVTRGKFESIAVQLPPLPEQQRIVAAIEEQFTRLDAAVDALQHTKARLKRSRASILKAAVKGKLTEAWRAEHTVDETASELLERILIERRAKWEADLRAKGKDPAKVKYVEPAEPNVEGLPDLPEEWCWATAEQIGDVGTGATPLRSRSDYYENGTIPWITSGALNSDIITYAEEFITEKALEETNVKVFPTGTLLVAMYGEGKTRGKVSELKINATTNQACAAIAFRPISALCQPYIKIFMQSNYIEIRRLAVGGAQPNLNLEIVKQTLIPLPPLSEQQQIVAEVEERLSVIAQAETAVEVSLKRAERTRQSILQMAFAGRLVPQDTDDEPASVLLERIREEREKAKDGGRANKRRVGNRDVSEPERVDVEGMEQVALWGSMNG